MELKRFNFGPPLIGLKVENELIDELLEKAQQLTKSANKNLAGKIKKEFFYTDEMIFKLSPKILKYIETYFRIITPEEYTIRHEVFLKNLWVNFQQANEYNPIHNHSDHISFVIYLKISEEIKSEKNETTGPPNGSITFHHGVNTNFKSTIKNDMIDIFLQPQNKVTIMPEAGEIYIFPAYLEHFVDAFYSENAERISVSGNIKIR